MFPYFAFYTSLCTCCIVWAKPPKENVSQTLHILAFYAAFMWFPQEHESGLHSIMINANSNVMEKKELL